MKRVTVFGIRLSDGTIRLCDDEAHAKRLVSWSVKNHCKPVWSVVKRNVALSDWTNA